MTPLKPSHSQKSLYAQGKGYNPSQGETSTTNIDHRLPITTGCVIEGDEDPLYDQTTKNTSNFSGYVKRHTIFEYERKIQELEMDLKESHKKVKYLENLMK
jgi:hypothetical protein